MSIVFDQAWFAHHQCAIIGALNVPVLGAELRHALKMPADRRRVAAVHPHAYVLDNADGSFEMDVRTHEKFAKRLHAEFLPIWQMLHWFDMRIANRFMPAFNLGFDTLTAYPDPDPESSSVDGYVQRAAVDESWNAIVTGSGQAASDTGDSIRAIDILSSATVNQWAANRRGITLFDTSSLTGTAAITAAVLSLCSLELINTLTPEITADIYTLTTVSNTSLTASDYTTFGSTSQTGAATTFSSLAAVGLYTDFILNATGRGNVSKTSISKFGCRNANYDAAAVAPTWTSATTVGRYRAYDADQIGSANDPKLVVTYTRSAVWHMPTTHVAGSGSRGMLPSGYRPGRV